MNLKNNDLLKTKINLGFTLIEMLLVVVIIGILVAVVIVVVNPTAQRARATNATIRSTLVKAGFAGVATLNASDKIPLVAPDGPEFFKSLSNASATGSNCTTVGSSSCTFFLNGVDTPDTCVLNGFNGSGTSPCNFYYARVGGATGDTFNIRVRRYDISGGATNLQYRYDSTTGAVIDTGTL